MSADQIRQSIADTGKVAFYGIYFDTDKAVVKPESEPALAEMAKFLKANAATKVFISGTPTARVRSSATRSSPRSAPPRW